MDESGYEVAIREALRGAQRAVSHADHVDRVLAIARDLHDTYGGDLDVLVAAVLLHGLGREDADLRGEAGQRPASALAGDLLARVDFPAELTPIVLEIVQDHERPGVQPTTLEGRILKDADFLAGLGPMGILRAALRTGERKGGIPDLLRELEDDLAEQMAGLEFEQSRHAASSSYVFMRLFLDHLRAETPLPSLPTAPYVVLEGIRGSGKTTQADMLYTRFAQEGEDPILIQEPTAWYGGLQETLDARQRDRQTQLMLLLGDRFMNVRHRVQDALYQGQPVVSDQGYPGSMVYQGESGWSSPAGIAYLHTLLPQPTHVLVLDLPAETALERLEAQARDSSFEPDAYETLEYLARYRQRFRALASFFPHLIVIDATDSEDAIHAAIWEVVSEKKD